MVYSVWSLCCAVLSFTFRILMVPLLYIYYGVQYGLGPVEVITSYNEITVSCGWFGVYIRTVVPSISGNGVR